VSAANVRAAPLFGLRRIKTQSRPIAVVYHSGHRETLDELDVVAGQHPPQLMAGTEHSFTAFDVGCSSSGEG
jgi:hypothetical protein